MKKTLALLVAAVLVVTALCACLTASAASTNVAAGKKYTTSLKYRQGGAEVNWGWDETKDEAYPDTDDKELTDGKFPTLDTEREDDDTEEITFYNSAFTGLHGSTPDVDATKGGCGYAWIRVDLGASYDLTELKAYFGGSKLGGGIGAPDTVEFWASTDGTNFTQVGETIKPADDGSNACVEVSLKANVTANYIEVRAVKGGWVFVAEVEAYADTAASGDDGKTEETPSDSKPAESKPADSGKPATGDTGIVVFAVLGIAAVAVAVVATKKRAR